MRRCTHSILLLTILGSLLPAYADPPIFINIGPMRIPGPEVSIMHGPMSREYDLDLDIIALANIGPILNPNRRTKVLVNLPGERPFLATFESLRKSDCCFTFTEDMELIADPDADIADFEFTWHGKGKKDQEVLIAVRQGVATGFITTAKGIWRVFFSRGSGRHLVRYIDETNYPDDIVVPVSKADLSRVMDDPNYETVKPRRSTSSNSKAASDAREINLLVVYTNNARIDASFLADGNPPNPANSTVRIDEMIAASISQMNLSLANSLVSLARVKLVASAQIGYVENPNDPFQQFLFDLQADPIVANMRDTNSADIVVMLAAEVVDTFCGVANTQRSNNCGPGIPEVDCDGIGPQFAPYAYAVVNTLCSADRADFAHELGHVLGLEHNPADFTLPVADASFPWSFGACFPDPHPANFRTILGNLSFACGSFGTPRQLYFSSDDDNVTFNGFLTGDSNQDNARTLMISTEVASQFRVNPDILFKDSFEL